MIASLLGYLLYHRLVSVCEDLPFFHCSDPVASSMSFILITPDIHFYFLPFYRIVLLSLDNLRKGILTNSRMLSKFIKVDDECQDKGRTVRCLRNKCSFSPTMGWSIVVLICSQNMRKRRAENILVGILGIDSPR